MCTYWYFKNAILCKNTVLRLWGRSECMGTEGLNYNK